MTPGFLCWPKPFQIQACVDLTQLFSTETSLATTFRIHLFNHYLWGTYCVLFWLLVTPELVPVGARKSGQVSTSTMKKVIKLWEVNFSFGKSEQTLLFIF